MYVCYDVDMRDDTRWTTDTPDNNTITITPLLPSSQRSLTTWDEKVRRWVPQRLPI